LQLIDTKKSFETDTFLRDLFFLAILEVNPMLVLCRMMVRSLTQVKHPQPPHHETVVVELIDTHHPDADPIIMFLERTASNHRPDPKYFPSHPSSATVLDSIVRTLKQMPNYLQSLRMTPRSNDSLSPLIPLFDITHTTSSPYHPIINEPESESERNTPILPLPWLDAITLAGTQIIHAASQSKSTSYRAEDRFVGAKNLEIYVPSLHNLRQIQFEPNSFSLFDLAALAETVHNHDPLYSMFKSNCFWLGQIVCGVVVKVCRCTTVDNPQYALVTEDDICIPANDYLPDLAGRWMGMLVCNIEETVISVVASNYQKFKEVKRTEVRFTIPSD